MRYALILALSFLAIAACSKQKLTGQRVPAKPTAENKGPATGSPKGAQLPAIRAVVTDVATGVWTTPCMKVIEDGVNFSAIKSISVEADVMTFISQIYHDEACEFEADLTSSIWTKSFGAAVAGKPGVYDITYTSSDDGRKTYERIYVQGSNAGSLLFIADYTADFNVDGSSAVNRVVELDQTAQYKLY